MMPKESEAAEKKVPAISISPERKAEIKRETDIIPKMQADLASAYSGGNVELAKQIALKLQAQIDKVVQMLK